MDKKVKFSEQPTKVKVIYGAVVAVLCITAIIIGIISVASGKNETPDPETPPVTDGEGEGEGEGTGEGEGEKLGFISPTVGTVAKGHSLEIPVFSTTLGDWRVHTGIDISAEEGAEVFAAADGTVSGVYSDPYHGKTVEITHSGGVVSRYSNLSADGITVNVGDEVSSGTKIGKIGDTSLSELADEPHLHFEIRVEGAAVNPLDYISEEEKKNSLGI